MQNGSFIDVHREIILKFCGDYLYFVQVFDVVITTVMDLNDKHLFY